MDELTFTQIQNLAQQRHNDCLSLYMPTHRGGAETLQGPVLWKNLLREAARQFESAGQAAPAWMEPLEALADDYNFWQHQSDGLAVFAAEGMTEKYRLPFSFPQHVSVGQGFAVRPLLQYLGEDTEFFLLALSQKTVKLWRCSQHTEEAVELPADIVEAWFDHVNAKAEKELQHHSAGAANGSAIFHGGAGSEVEKARLRSGIERLDNGLEHLWKNSGLPVVIAAVESLAAAYRDAANYKRFAAKFVAGNPDQAIPAQLRQKAWTIVAEAVAAQREAEIGRWQQAQANFRGSNDRAALLEAAGQGRLDTLILGGTVDAQDPEDVLVRAALRTNARVLVYDAAQLPKGETALGVYRY
jgi:hypothetical protein